MKLETGGIDSQGLFNTRAGGLESQATMLSCRGGCHGDHAAYIYEEFGIFTPSHGSHA